jgi:hypothetical protein
MLADGQGSPRMCSLSASPVPTPRRKLPFARWAAVAAAWATMAGWVQVARTGDGCGDRQVHRLRKGADRGPHEAALPLCLVPRVEVIGDPQRLEARVPGHQGLIDLLARGEFLAGCEVPDLGHRRLLESTG